MFALALSLSNIALIRREGASETNVLGILMSVFIVLFAFLLIRFDYCATGSSTEVMIQDLIVGVMYSLWLYLEIDNIDPNGKVAYSTTGYHVFRSGVFARRVKLRAVGIASGTRWYFRPNVSVRELIGLLTGNIEKQLIVFAGIIVVYSVSVIISLVF